MVELVNKITMELQMVKDISIKLSIGDDNIEYVIAEDDDVVVISSRFEIEPSPDVISIVLDNIKRDVIYTLNT